MKKEVSLKIDNKPALAFTSKKEARSRANKAIKDGYKVGIMKADKIYFVLKLKKPKKGK